MADNLHGSPDADEKAFARGVASFRERMGWSQSELARRMVSAGWTNYSQMTVSRTEKGDRPIRLSEARALANIFDADIDSLLHPDHELKSAIDLKETYNSLRFCWNELHGRTTELLELHDHWRDAHSTAAEILQMGTANDELKQLIEKEADVEEMTVEAAVEHGRIMYARNTAAFAAAVDEATDAARGK